MDAIQKLTGNTAEGQQMMKIMRQMNELTELHNSAIRAACITHHRPVHAIRWDCWV